LSLLDDEKNSPIHLCAQKGHFELLKYFLEKFPQADTKNIYGKTPLDLASSDKIRDLLLDFLNKKSYNFHKITIHTANSKIVNEFLNNIKDKKTQTQSLENFSNNNNNFLSKNNNAISNNFNITQGIKTNNDINSLNNSNSKSNPHSNIFDNLKDNDLLKNNISEKQNINYNNYLSNGNNNNLNIFDQKSSSSGSSFKNSSNNPINSSLDNLKFKTIKSADNCSEEHSSGSNLEHFSSYEEERIGPSSFICHALLGKGSFGEVYLVEKRDTKIFYAMKVLSKDKIMGKIIKNFKSIKYFFFIFILL